MATDKSTLELNPVGSDFQLKKTEPNGASAAVILDAGEMLELARRLPQYARQILQLQNPQLATRPQIEISSVVSVADVIVNSDIYQSTVLLFVHDTLGLQSHFALSAHQARVAALSLEHHADIVEPPTRPKN